MAKLTHKLRNPKDLTKWLNIWTANVTDASTYTISPSSQWVISPARISGGDSYANALAQYDENGILKKGPTIGSGLKTVSNALQVNAGDGLSLTTSGAVQVNVGTGLVISNDIINHSNTVTAGTVGPTQTAENYVIPIPSITFDNCGHITETRSYSHTIPIASTSSAGLAPKISTNSSYAQVLTVDKSGSSSTWRKINFNKQDISTAGTTSSIAYYDPNKRDDTKNLNLNVSEGGVLVIKDQSVLLSTTDLTLT